MRREHSRVSSARQLVTQKLRCWLHDWSRPTVVKPFILPELSAIGNVIIARDISRQAQRQDGIFHREGVTGGAQPAFMGV
jgi:hypothetical protein